MLQVNEFVYDAQWFHMYSQIEFVSPKSLMKLLKDLTHSIERKRNSAIMFNVEVTYSKKQEGKQKK